MNNIFEKYSGDFAPIVVMRPQDPEEEFERVWEVLGKMDFFREHGYVVELPDHPLFKNLAHDSLAFSNADVERIKNIFIAELYDKDFFSFTLSRLEQQRRLVASIFQVLHVLHEEWGFKLFPEYSILLTRYGTSGSYYPKTGKILIGVNATGFKRPNLTHTIVHELIHLGIEENIVQRFHLTHPEKERLVDVMLVKKFSQLLPDEYHMQSIGDSKVDKYISVEALRNLPASIEKYIIDFPR